MVAKCRLQLRLYDGSRELFPPRTKVLVTIINGQFEQLVRDTFTGPQLDFDLPFYNGIADRFTVITYVDGYRQAGYTPISLSPEAPVCLDLLLPPRDPVFNFAGLDFHQAKNRLPFFAMGSPETVAQAHFEELLERSPKVLACMLNLVTAMRFITLGDRTPLDYLRQLRWAPDPPAQDRFFVYCDADLIDDVRAATNKGLFAPEYGCGVFHAGASLSWKEIQLQNANVQLTFHTNPGDCVTEKKWVTLEPDIDYFKDPGSHALLEVCQNKLTGSLTEPAGAYVLRWIEHRHKGLPDFNPPYTLRAE